MGAVRDDDLRITAIMAKPYGRIVYPEDGGEFFATILEFPGCMAVHTTAAKALSSLERVARSRILARKGRQSSSVLPLLRAQDCP